MARLPILRYPDPRLLKPSKPVTRFDTDLKTLVQDMAQTMYEAPGIGLAAPQINVHQCIVVIDVSEKAHWETRLPETGELVEFDGVYPEDKKTGDIVQNVQTYYLYTPYTEEELATMEKESQERAIQKEISTLKSNLQETDYVATKIAEGVSSKEDYTDILARRAEWRQEINDLESQLDSLK